MNYIFIGFKAAGKSTIGKSFAEASHLTFIDLDHVIEELEDQGRNCREIFNQSGSDYFRELERKALYSLKDQNNIVLALGGGTLDNKNNHSLIKELGKVIYLDCDQKMVYARIEKEGFPKFIDSFETFEKLYKQRSATYNEVADIIISCNTDSVTEPLQEIFAKIKE